MYPQYFKTIDLESGLLSFNGYKKSDEKIKKKLTIGDNGIKLTYINKRKT